MTKKLRILWTYDDNCQYSKYFKKITIAMQSNPCFMDQGETFGESLPKNLPFLTGYCFGRF